MSSSKHDMTESKRTGLCLVMLTLMIDGDAKGFPVRCSRVANVLSIVLEFSCGVPLGGHQGVVVCNHCRGHGHPFHWSQLPPSLLVPESLFLGVSSRNPPPPRRAHPSHYELIDPGSY